MTVARCSNDYNHERIIGIRSDLSIGKGIGDTAKMVLERWSTVDILINNVGGGFT